MERISPQLPPSASQNLVVVQPTQKEKQAVWTLNGQSWRGSIDIPTYLRREEYLENQNLTRDGGITFWILVDVNLLPNARPILSSCESIRKKAIVASGNNEITDTTSHGIASVYCNPEYRGRGYAQRMINEVGKKLDDWQQEGKRTSFTILYSDIGKIFYSRMGWHPFPSRHIALPPVAHRDIPPQVRYLRAQDLPELCKLDEQWLRSSIERSRASQQAVLVALIPDHETMLWHHAREEFAGKEMLKRNPEFKGAHTRTEDGDQVWCIWTRTFGSDETGNTLNILRVVIEGDQGSPSENAKCFIGDDARTKAKIQAGAAILQAAQLEAARWSMNDVQLWNPTPMTVSAARQIDPSAQLTDRDKDSIASLRWHGANAEDQHIVKWIGNEKYGWC